MINVTCQYSLKNSNISLLKYDASSIFTLVHGELLEQFRTLFSYNFEELSVGFGYLGHHLKAEKITFEEWRWLIIKFEKMINRWLILGGRYIFAKMVLETQSVYSMALAAVSIFVLSKIHKLIFDFIWLGGGKTQGIHLCS